MKYGKLWKQPKMRLLALALALPLVVCGAEVRIPSAPEAAFADTEAETNAVICAADADDNRFRLTLELDATTNNCVMVEFGRDEDMSGVLDRREVEFSVGWSAGRWVCRDRMGGGFASAGRPSGRRRLAWTMALDASKSARSLVAEDGGEAVFRGVVPPTFYGAEWNMVRVVRRGAAETDESVGYDLSTAPLYLILR